MNRRFGSDPNVLVVPSGSRSRSRARVLLLMLLIGAIIVALTVLNLAATRQSNPVQPSARGHTAFSLK